MTKLPLCLGDNGIAPWEECSDDAKEAFLDAADRVLKVIE